MGNSNWPRYRTAEFPLPSESALLPSKLVLLTSWLPLPPHSKHRTMPLPIETPAPKASSIIKRFQQTIDNLDGQPALPLPKPRLSQDPEEIAQNRRSWSVGSGGAPLPLNQVAWTAPPGSQLSKSSDAARSEADPQSSPFSSHLINTCRSPQSLADNNKADPTIPSQLDIPLTPPIHQSPDLSRLADLSQSDLAVQKPPSSATNNTKAASPRPKVKATISSDARQIVRSRKQTNITAPTAASLAKIRASDNARSQSQSNGPTTRNQPTNTPAGALGANNLPKSASTQRIAKPPSSASKPAAVRKDSDPAHLRDIRAASASTPKERTRMESIRASTPAPSTAFKKSVIAKTKVPPLPNFGPAPPANAKTAPPSPAPPVKLTRRVISADPQKSTKPAPAPSNPTGSATKPIDKRPLQRTRVASVATPISSGIKKSPSLKSSAAQPSARVASAASPKLTVTGTSGMTRTPDLSTPKAKTRTSSVKGSSTTVRKSPILPSVPFPEGSSDQASIKSAKKPSSAVTSGKSRSASRTPTQLMNESPPTKESNDVEAAGQDPVTSVEEGTEGLEAALGSSAEETSVPAGEAAKEPEASVTEGVEDPVPSLADRDVDPSAIGEHAEPPTVAVVDIKAAKEDQEDQEEVGMVLEELEGLKLAHLPLEQLHKHHRLPEAADEDESSRPDFDASTTTNTDGEE
ncbi:hypothetical protein PtA15_4A11 [Puccinia triticina]|nr:uncharacterized protein PtA15_4A11 [Puccinia triticina]WAQ83563.1 hypothetical protein PtA15_4A11 [Puccinia triticina]